MWKRIPFFLVLLISAPLLLSGCTPGRKAAAADNPTPLSAAKPTEPPVSNEIDVTVDLSGEYDTVQVEEVLGSDPLGGSPIKITVQKEDTFYIFTIIHREKELSRIKKPWLDREFRGRMEQAESEYLIRRTPKGLACEVMADDHTYHFVVFFKKTGNSQ